MIPYFSTFDAPIDIILFSCGLFLSGMFGASYAVFCKDSRKLDMVKGAIIGGLYYIGLMWLFNGDSFTWSKPIGDWLTGS